MVREISNSDDVIDSRDVIARIEELEAEREALADTLKEAKEAAELPADDEAQREALDDAVTAAEEALTEWDDDYAEELKALKALAEEAEGYAEDWLHGAALIRQSYWVEYVEELLADIGDLPRDLPSYIEIDWDKTADNIAVDYTEVDYDGVTYLVR